MPAKTEVTKHDNEPLFEVGKAYKLTDGTNRRVFVQAVETTRVKADEVEFNQHRYKAVIIERGDKLSIRESALVATVKTKPCRVTKAELAQYEIESEGNGSGPDDAGKESPAGEQAESAGTRKPDPAAEPDQTTSGDAQPREPEKAARESESGEAVSLPEAMAATAPPTIPGVPIAEARELLELRAFRDAIHEQWEHLGLASGVSLVAAVEGALEAERHATEQKRNDEGLENADLVADLLEKERETVKQLRADLDAANGVAELRAERPPRTGVFVNEGMSAYQIGKLVAKAISVEPTIVVSRGKSG